MKYNLEQYSILDKDTGLLDLQADICIRIRALPYNYSETLSEQRALDLISYEQYGTYDLWWVLAIYNKILNPFNLLAQTNVIYVPDFVKVQDLLIRDSYVRI